jgi:hypothetical protein
VAEFSKSKSGIGYFLPLEIEKYQVKSWTLYFQTYDEDVVQFVLNLSEGAY